MQITIRGELTIPQLRQAIYEQLHDLEDSFALGHSLGATLYVNPSDGLGDPVVVRGRDGRKIEKLTIDGPYKCAADDYKLK